MENKEPTPLADERTFTNELFGAELFWEKHKITILAAFGALLVAAIGFGLWSLSQYRTAQAASEAFLLANDVEAWREVIAKYPATPQAGSAMLLLAAALREDGDIPASNREFNEFLQNFPKHPLAGVAELGLAENAFAEGKNERSLEILQQAAQRRDFAAPLALFLQAREFTDQARFADARTALADLASQFPESVPARMVPGQVQQIDVVAPPGGSPLVPESASSPAEPDSPGEPAVEPSVPEATEPSAAAEGEGEGDAAPDAEATDPAGVDTQAPDATDEEETVSEPSVD